MNPEPKHLNAKKPELVREQGTDVDEKVCKNSEKNTLQILKLTYHNRIKNDSYMYKEECT